jgi:membrane fusion protein (multidrug efflux system)
MDAKVDVSQTDGRMLADGSRTSAVAQTTVFDQNNSAADAEVSRIIAANGGAAVTAAPLASAAKPAAKHAAAASATSSAAAASMATLAAGAHAPAVK